MRPGLRPLLSFVLALVAAVAWAPPASSAERPAAIVSIGLSLGQRHVILGSTRGFEIQDPSDGRALRRFGAGGRVRLRSRGGGIGFGGKSTLLRLVVKPLAGSLLELNGQAYRGTFEIREGAGGKITVANVIDVESYLYGVVKSEMPAGAGLEAMKVQAIIARTFALKNRDNFSERGFGLKATEESQVYVGVRGESPEARLAVDETRGIVLSHGNQLATIFYSAACGGSTESNDAVWGGNAVPYLHPVACNFCQTYSGFRWSADLPFDEISRKLRAAGWPVGRIDQIRLDRSRSGRVQTVVLKSDRGTTSIPGNKFRLILGHRRVKSLRFGILQQLASTAIASDSDADGMDAGEAAIRGVIHRYISESSTVTRESCGAHLRVSGTGYGHGVGLCQWGAKGQADRGRDYRQMLRYYFSGTRLARAY